MLCCVWELQVDRRLPHCTEVMEHTAVRTYMTSNTSQAHHGSSNMTHLKRLHPAGTLRLRLCRTCYRRFLQRRHLVVQLLLLRSRACAAAGRACRECIGGRLSCRLSSRLQLGLELDNAGLQFGDDAGITTNRSVSQTRYDVLQSKSLPASHVYANCFERRSKDDAGLQFLTGRCTTSPRLTS